MNRQPFICSFFVASFALLNLHCESSQPAGPQMQSVGGGEMLVTISQGSLVTESPRTDPERDDALQGYLRDHPELFGPADVAPEDLTFAETTPQAQMTNEAGEIYTLLALHQTVLGAPVIDEMQMGAFFQTPDGDELRRVRGHLRDPSSLPTPPDPMVVSRDRVLPTVSELIAARELSADLTTLSDDPVIAVKENISGYLISSFEPTETGSGRRFRAVVDPRDLRVVVLEDQPPCDSTAEVPAGNTLILLPSTPYTPPGLAGLRFIPIQAVALSDSDGSNLAPITRQQIRIWVDAANQVWVPQAKVVFNFDDSAGSKDFETWNATFLNTVPPDDETYSKYNAAASVWALLFHHDKLVVFFRARGGGGWSWGPTSTFFVSMPSYTNTGINKPGNGGWVSNDTVLSHELGHHMGLAHPFSGVACFAATLANGNGDATGQDENTTADDVTDTNPDLSDTCLPTNSLTCPGGTTVYNDQTWDPPWDNVMSYHDCLPEMLTPSQVNVINLTLQHPVRANLIQ